MSITFSCDGSSWHSCNFANTNALDLLDLIGENTHPEPAYAGHWSVEDLAKMQSRILRAVNVYEDRQHLVRPPMEDERVFYGGNSDKQTVLRLKLLQLLLKHAQDHDLPVVWG